MRQDRFLFGLVGVIAAFLIFHRLGVPSLWLDEVSSPLSAVHPVSYILELSQRLEEHPPLFYLLLKTVMAFGHSDAVVRLLPAFCGLGCVLMTALVGRTLFGWPAGLVAAALWLAMPQNLWLSRMARPYSLWQFFFLCSLFFLFRFRRGGRAADIAGMLAANVLMAASHYLSFLLFAAEAGCLAAMRSKRRGGPGWQPVMAYAAGVCCLAAATYFGFIWRSQVPREIAGNGDTLAAMAGALYQALAGTLYYFDNPAARVAWLLASVAGFAVVWRTDREAFRQLALLVAVPLALFLIIGKSTGLYERHLSFLAAPLCLAIGGGAAAFPGLVARRGWLVAAVLALAAGNALYWRQDDFYTVKSYQVPVIGNNYKMTADALAARYAPGAVFSFSNDFFGNAVSWYLAQIPRPNPVADQRLTETDPLARVYYVASTHYGYLAWSGEEFRKRYGPVAETAAVDSSTLYALEVARDPVRRITTLPARTGLPMDFRGFFAAVAALDGVRYHQNARGPGVIPTRNDVDATVRTVIENLAPPEPQDIYCNILYDNTGRDSLLAARVTFDDEPPTTYPLSTGYDAVHQRQVVVRRVTPYKRLAIEVVMRCASLTPTLSGGNLETLRLRDVQVFVCPDRDAGCPDAAERHLTASVLDNFLEERFLPSSEVEQEIDTFGQDNMVESGEEGQKAWTRMTPLDPGRAGTVRVEVSLDRPQLFFFPRVGAGSAVHVWALDGGARRELLFGLYNESEQWNPISARYEMVVPPRLRGKSAILEIELTGPWAQLWRLGDAIFF